MSSRPWRAFDSASKQQTIASLEEQAADPDFWLDPQAGQATMRQLTQLRDELAPWERLRCAISEHQEMAQLAAVERDDSIIEEIDAELTDLDRELDQLEFKLRLSGPHDRKDALLAIHAGAGGTDSQDWAAILQRMYLRWAEQRRFRAEILDQMEGEEAGIKSTTIEISGAYAYGYMQSERGVHRLVRLSPFDSAHRRHTSFALVEVLPDIEDTVEVVIRMEDVKVDTYRATGAGGQHVNKTDSAVRMTHLPTGVVVTCQNERSQGQNREVAMKILKARLYDLQLQEQAKQQAILKGDHVEAGWGNQIRSYVLHPYNMVKDLRTGYETANTAGVLDGDLDGLIQAFLMAPPSEVAR